MSRVSLFRLSLNPTVRYCDLARLTATKGIKYKRIASRGLAIPPEKDVEMFTEVVNDFLAESPEDEAWLSDGDEDFPKQNLDCFGNKFQLHT